MHLGLRLETDGPWLAEGGATDKAASANRIRAQHRVDASPLQELDLLLTRLCASVPVRQRPCRPHMSSDDAACAHARMRPCPHAPMPSRALEVTSYPPMRCPALPDAAWRACGTVPHVARGAA